MAEEQQQLHGADVKSCTMPNLVQKKAVAIGRDID